MFVLCLECLFLLCIQINLVSLLIFTYVSPLSFPPTGHKNLDPVAAWLKFTGSYHKVTGSPRRCGPYQSTQMKEEVSLLLKMKQTFEGCGYLIILIIPLISNSVKICMISYVYYYVEFIISESSYVWVPI